MTPALLYALTGITVFGIGLYGFILHAHWLRKILALNVMGGGVFLLLIGLANRIPNPSPDPVPHAMVLTGIVVAVSATGLALALVRRLYAMTGQTSFTDPTPE
ncbi:MAG: hypothetical protein ETSY1_20570 [Candidatus Entotheonella factor]|uniref:NADH-ubiquinone oxidoreductase subunit 4L n=1 Tax=Entotheonella factor TaxID=1429438 RepID=W4LIQ0_ENTF1|nr:cation:proton antiporter subunit C [Candidatus Entotheonella palauensis]ETW97988.1 MAG: hypothetical protein ETSY1_20570 [Candidatus Entotheonella factor]